MRAFAAALLVALSMPAAAVAADPATPAAAPAYPQARPFDAAADAATQLDDAMARAKASGKKVLLVMGANWCHDSRALAGWLKTPRLQQLVADRYELLFVDVGRPQKGNGRNLELASRFGIEMKATPAVLILSPEGALLNADSATSWKNAASRSEAEIYGELAG